MIGIITALPSEANWLAQELVTEQRERVGGIDFLIGDIKNSFVCLAVGGVGKVNAAMCAQIMIDRYNVGVIFNCGVAGGRAGSVERGDLVVADSLVQHDVDTSALGDPKGFVSTVETVAFDVNETMSLRLASAVKKLKLPCKRGVIASGDQFVSGSGKVVELAEAFGAIAFDMEGGAIAQVCRRNGVEFVAVRAITDFADEKGGKDFKLSLEECALLPQRAVYETLK